MWTLVGGYSVEFHPGMGSDPDLSMKVSSTETVAGDSDHQKVRISQR